MNKFKICFVICDILSSIIMGLGMNDMLSGFILVTLSFPLLMKPSMLLPLLFVSSWSSSISVLGIAAFYYYLALFLISLIINPNQVRWRIKRSLFTTFLLLAFAAWIMVSAYNSLSGGLYIPFKIVLFIIFPIICSISSVSDMDLCYDTISRSAVFFAVYFFLRSVFAPIEMYDPELMTTDVTLIQGVGTNVMAQAIVMLLLYSFATSVEQKRYDWLIISFLFILSLFYLGSRTSAYTSIIFLAIYFIFFVDTKITYKLLLLCVISLSSLLLFVVGSSFENFARLDLSTIQEDQGSGRFINWGLYIMNIIPNYRLFGIGPGVENYMALGYKSDADNMYMDLICELGIPGLTIFTILFICLVSKASHIQSRFYRGLFLTLILLHLSIGFGETVFDTCPFWFIAGMTLLEHNRRGTTKKYKVLLNNNTSV